jgi:transposase
MTKHYVLVSNEQRQILIRLIHKNGYSISKAAKIVNVYYPTAKAINKVYLKENRIKKKSYYSSSDENDEANSAVAFDTTPSISKMRKNQ